MRTFNDGDNFKGNGRAENAIAQVKRGARTLLIAAGLDESFWCHAARHWAEGRLRRQLESMGWKKRDLAPFEKEVLQRQAEVPLHDSHPGTSFVPSRDDVNDDSRVCGSGGRIRQDVPHWRHHPGR